MACLPNVDLAALTGKVCYNILLFSASFIYRVIQSSDAVLKLVIWEISWAENNPSPADSPPSRSYDVFLQYCDDQV
jgi:hypothetical protein